MFCQVSSAVPISSLSLVRDCYARLFWYSERSRGTQPDVDCHKEQNWQNKKKYFDVLTMANISASLKDYLSKSGKSGSPTEQNPISGSGTSGFWFTWGKESKSEKEVIDETSNGWFSEAQKDPCLPSLVSKHVNTLVNW